MRNRLALVGLLLLVVVSVPSTSSANQFSFPFAQAHVSAFGEVAYTLDGDIWLLDLDSGDSEKLTSGGNNSHATWSPDGRYLAYTRNFGSGDASVYVLEVGTGEPHLLAEAACCAEWSDDGARIAYLSMQEGTLNLKTKASVGSEKTTLLGEISAGQDPWPTGNVLWNGEVSDQFILVPLEVLVDTGDGGLEVYESIFQIDQSLHTFRESQDFSGQPGCNVRQLAVQSAESGTYIAVPIDDYGSCGMETAKGVYAFFSGTDSREIGWFPWLSYPSWSPDGRFLVAEQYTPSPLLDQSELEGVVIYDLTQETYELIVSGAMQPAWRPGSSLPVAISSLLHPGEIAVSVDTVLSYQGSEYQIYFVGRGDFWGATTPTSFSEITPAYFQEHHITALIVTKDGSVVEDSETLTKIFTLFTAGSYLYEEITLPDLPVHTDVLTELLQNPLVSATEPDNRYQSYRSQVTEALRSLLTDQLTPVILTDAAMQALPETSTGLPEALKLLSDSIKTQRDHGPVQSDVAKALSAIQNSIDEAEPWSNDSAQAVQVALRVLYTMYGQEWRSAWLSNYTQGFRSGAGALDRDQLVAAVTVMNEIKEQASVQENLVTDLLQDHAIPKISSADEGDRDTEASETVTKYAEQFRLPVVAHSLAAGLSTSSQRHEPNRSLYRAGNIHTAFMLAQRMQELQAAFRAGRLSLQTNARTSRHEMTYNGNLIERFHAAYMLEALAAVQSRRFYADGILFISQIANGQEVLDELDVQYGKVEVNAMQHTADRAEKEAMDSLGRPAYVDTAVGLALSRLLSSAVDESTSAGGDSEDRAPFAVEETTRTPTVTPTPEPTPSGIIANGWRIIPVETFEKETDNGRKQFILRVAVEKLDVGQGERARSWCGDLCRTGGYNLLTQEGYTYNQSQPRNFAVNLPVAYGRAVEMQLSPPDYWWWPPGFVMQGNVIGIGWLQVYGWGFLPAASTGGYTVATPFGNLDPTPVEVKFPTSRPDSDFLWLGDSFLLGDVRITPKEMKITGPGNPFQLKVTWQFENTHAGFGRRVSFQSAALGSTGVHIDYQSGTGISLGPSQSGETETTYYVPPGETNIKIILSGFEYQPEGQAAPNPYGKESFVIYNFTDSTQSSLSTDQAEQQQSASSVEESNTASTTTAASGNDNTASEASFQPVQLQILVNGLNVRKGPGTGYDRVGQLESNDLVTAIDRNLDNSWWKICCVNELTGWIINDPEYVGVQSDLTDVQTSKMSSEVQTNEVPICSIGVDRIFDSLWQRHRDIVGCPRSKRSTIETIAEEIFQGGHMFWRKDTDEIFAIYDGDKTTGARPLAGRWMTDPAWKWDGSNPEGIALTPPAGLVEPKLGFGWVWRNYLGRENGPLGWALDREYGFDNVAQIQVFENGFMFRGSDPRVYLLLNDGRFYAQ